MQMQSNTWKPFGLAAGGHALLDCGHHCTHASQLLATLPCGGGKNVKFSHFLGERVESKQCNCIAFYVAILLLLKLCIELYLHCLTLHCNLLYSVIAIHSKLFRLCACTVMPLLIPLGAIKQIGLTTSTSTSSTCQKISK